MLNKIKREYYLRSADFDGERRLHPSAVLDIFQDIAGVHAEHLGIGFERLYDRGLLWVLVRTKYEQYRSLPRFCRVTAESWPLPPKSAGFTREYLITDSEGNTVIKGTSDWVVIDAGERKLVSAKDMYPLTEFCLDKNFEGRTHKLHDFEGEYSHTVTPRFSDTDLNGHVNNTKYLNYVLDCGVLPRESEFFSVQIDYRHEIMEGEEVAIYAAVEGKEHFYKGTAPDGTVYFNCKIETK